MYLLAVDTSQRTIDLDQFILDRLAADDDLGLTLLYDTYYNLMMGIIRYHVQDPDDCDDVMQELFANIWERRHTLNLPNPLGPYLAAAALNSARVFLRNTRRRRESPLPEDTWEDVGQQPAETVPEDGLTSEEIAALTALACRTMSPRVRATYTLIRNEGLTYSEAAVHLGISVKTVEKHISTALKVLRRIFGPHVNVLLITSSLAWIA